MFNVIFQTYIEAYSRLIQPYLVLHLRYIKSPGIFRDILIQPYSQHSKCYTQYLGTVGHIHVYKLYMAYSGIFRTVDIFSQFQVHYSGITQ